MRRSRTSARCPTTGGAGTRRPSWWRRPRPHGTPAPISSSSWPTRTIGPRSSTAASASTSSATTRSSSYRGVRDPGARRPRAREALRPHGRPRRGRPRGRRGRARRATPAEKRPQVDARQDPPRACPAGAGGGAGRRRGAAEFCGARAGWLDAGRRLGYLAELFRFPGWSSAEEVLALHQRLSGSAGGGWERHELLELVGLSDARDRRVEQMSKGMQQRLGIAQALVGSPPLLLLDEPTSALDPVGRRTVRLLLEELQRRGTSVLLNSHLLSEVELVCDRVVILLGGSVVAEGSPAELGRARGVEVETDHGTTVFEGKTREDIPALVAELVAAGRKVYGVRVLTSTLEETYLEAVGEEQS